MAAYAATVTLDHPGGAMPLREQRMGIALGSVNITNYNQTNVEITGITNLFRTGATVRVILDGSSDAGYVGQWDATNGTIVCYYADYDAGADGALIEAASDVDAGAFNFIALGVAR